MKKVVVFSTSLNPGGLERYLLRFLKYADNTIDITVVVRSGKTGELYDEYKQFKVGIIFWKVGFFNPVNWFKIYKFLKKGDFDTICDITANFAGIPVWLAKLGNIKNRISYYGSSSDHFKVNFAKNIYNKILNRLVFHYSTLILSNSQTAFDYFFAYRKKNDDRFHVINNGVDRKDFERIFDITQIRAEFNIPERAVVVGHTGRYSWPKNFPLLVSIAKHVCNKYPEAYFIFCGRDTDVKLFNDFPEIQAFDRIKILGFQRDVPKILSIYDIFVFPSITEGQPNSLLEAMIAGIPIIASDIPPIRECVPQNHIAHLIDLKNEAEFFRQTDFLIENKEAREALNYAVWAKQRYDSDVLFGEFKDYLLR